MRQNAWIVAVVGLIAISLSAQDGPKPPDVMPPGGWRPIVTVREPITKPLALTKADIHVAITGYIAQTTMTLTFRNDNSRVIEGELVFPLPQGATVSGYGLDVNGVLVDGVPVEKQKARVAFETEVRKGVDPGLVEHVTGNNFRTRLYPIPANGERTVKVQYISDLSGDKDSATYTLPMNWGNEPVGQYRLKVELTQPPAEPVLSGAPADLKLEKAENRLLAEKTYTNAQFKNDLVITLPKLPAQHVAIEKFQQVPGGWADYFFVINDLPPIPADRPQTPAIQKLGVLWDASYSRADSDKAREINLLKQIAAKLNVASVDVVVFRNKAEAPVNVKIDELAKFLESIPYDGGTNLGQLAVTKDHDCWLLFTDGLNNLLSETPGKIEAPVYTISNDSRANHTLLGHLAQTSGGQYFNLKRTSDEQVLAGLTQSPFALLSVECKEGEVGDVYPNGPQAVIGRLAIAGRLKTPQATISLNYGHGKTVSHTVTYKLSQDQASSTGLAGRFWAQQKLADLAVFAEKNHDELLRVGRDFNIVTPNTSLMVLETLEQHLTYHITPPKTRPDLYNAYVAQIEQRQEAERKTAQQKLDQVAAMWQERVKWWRTEFRYPRHFRYVEPKPAQTGNGRLHGGGGWGGGGGGFGLGGAAPAPAGEPMLDAPRPAARPADASRRLEGKDAKGDDAPAGPTIAIRAWDPETPYLVAIKNAHPDQYYAVYLEQRKKFGNGPSFFLDCADFFLKHEQQDIAVRILTAIAELELANAPLLRIVAYRLVQLGEYGLGIDLFEKVLRLRPEEPQSYRDLALALADRAEHRADRGHSPGIAKLTRNDYTRALNLLNQVVIRPWDGRFPQIEVIALMEANRLIANAHRIGITDLPNPLDKRLVKLLDLDVRISLTWDADATDIDLWVTEPSCEKCDYSHNRTTIGGLISNDFTQGYGPEEYCLRKLMTGEYKIQANYYGSSQQKITGPTTIQATIITNFARPNEKRQSITLRLVGQKETIDIGTVKLEEPK